MDDSNIRTQRCGGGLIVLPHLMSDPEEAKRSPVRTFLSGLVHCKEPVAADIGLALAAALGASPDDRRAATATSAAEVFATDAR